MMPLQAFATPTKPPELVQDQPPAWLEARLAALLDATVIESPTRFRFADLDPFDLATPGPLQMVDGGRGGLATRGAPGGFGSHPLAEIMWQVLYNYAYARSFWGKAAQLPSGRTELMDPAFIGELRAANHGRQRWDGFWTVQRADRDGSVHIEKAGNHRKASAGEYALATGPGRPVTAGDLVSCRVTSESTDSQPGFYFAFSETVASDHDDGHLVRLYFHLSPAGVPWLLSWLTRDLDRYRVPYRIKCLAQPALYDRCDPVVLYVAKRFLQPLLRILAQHRKALEEHLLPDVPLCSKPLLEGLGAADEPGNARSFGQTRSYIIAQGILDAWASGTDSRDMRLAYTSFRFRQLGLSLSQPHLSEGALDRYQWPATVSLEAHSCRQQP